MDKQGEPPSTDDPALADEELLAAFYDGDNDALEELHNRYNYKLYRLCMKNRLSHHDAEDCVQLTFVKVHGSKLQKDAGKPGWFDPSKGFSFSAWLYRIHQNNCMDLLRKRGVQQKVFVSEIDGGETDQPPLHERVPDPGKLQDQLMMDAELSRALYSALDELPYRQRAILYLFFIEGEMTRSEIAHILGVSPPTVMREIEKGSRRLKEILTQWGALRSGPANPPSSNTSPQRRSKNV